MPLLETDPDYQSQALQQIREAAEDEPTGVLRHGGYDVLMPLLVGSAGQPLPCHEPADETAAVSAHMSARIRAFYTQLAAYHAGLDNPPDSIGIGLYIQPQDFEQDPDCEHRKYHSRRLHLHQPETLPDLAFVSSLTVRSMTSAGGGGLDRSQNVRPLSPLVPLQCLVHLSQVREWRAPWMWERPMPAIMPSRVMREHYSWPWEGPLRDARHEFGAAITDQEKHLCGRRIPATLTRASLHFWTPTQLPNEDQSVARPNLVHPADRDPVSVGLCKLATQLQLFDVRALVTPDLFPAPGAPDDQHWSQMRRFRLEIHPLRPDGRWYFVGPRGEDPHDSGQGGYQISATQHYPREHDTEEDQELHAEWEDCPDGGSQYDAAPDMFRIEPCRERVEPLLAAFARAVARDKMPSLEDAEMFAHLWWHPSNSRAEEYGLPENFKTRGHRWGVKFVAGNGEGDAAAAAAAAEPVVQWQVGDWRPSQEVLSLFEGLGRQEWLDFEVDNRRSFRGFDLLGYDQR